MKKSLGVKPYLFPMPVIMVATYNDDNTVNVMTMSWGGICGKNMVALNLNAEHRTTANIKKRKAFTLSIADVPHLKEAAFFGIASNHMIKDKFENSGLTAEKSENVDAPIITEFPVTLECKMTECQDETYGVRIIGEIINVLAEESVVGENGKIEAGKLNAFAFDPFEDVYYAIGEKIGQA